MSDYVLCLHTNATHRPILRGQAGETLRALTIRALVRWPFLPITHLSCDGRPVWVSSTDSQEKGDTVQDAPQKTRKRKQGYAERYRQHWIDKDNAKKSS